MSQLLLAVVFLGAVAAWTGALVFIVRAGRNQKAHFGWPKIGGLNFDIGETGQEAARKFYRGDYKGQKRTHWEALRREWLKAIACMASFAILLVIAAALGSRV